jgi:hypothetical protein
LARAEKPTVARVAAINGARVMKRIALPLNQSIERASAQSELARGPAATRDLGLGFEEVTAKGRSICGRMMVAAQNRW